MSLQLLTLGTLLTDGEQLCLLLLSLLNINTISSFERRRGLFGCPASGHSPSQCGKHGSGRDSQLWQHKYDTICPWPGNWHLAGKQGQGETSRPVKRVLLPSVRLQNSPTKWGPRQHHETMGDNSHSDTNISPFILFLRTSWTSTNPYIKTLPMLSGDRETYRLKV